MKVKEIMNEQFDQKLHTLLSEMANEGMFNAARGMADMVGQPLNVTEPTLRRVPLTQIPHLLGGPESEAVGIYLRMEGELAGQMMLIVPYPRALELADLMMGEPTGTTQSLGRLERSALAELGNLTGTFFLNAVATATGMESRPSPPAIMVDMVGAILDIILATTGGLSETVPMIQATFLRGGREVQAEFWIIPDHSTLNKITPRD